MVDGEWVWQWCVDGEWIDVWWGYNPPATADLEDSVSNVCPHSQTAKPQAHSSPAKHTDAVRTQVGVDTAKAETGRANTAEVKENAVVATAAESTTAGACELTSSKAVEAPESTNAELARVHMETDPVDNNRVIARNESTTVGTHALTGSKAVEAPEVTNAKPARIYMEIDPVDKNRVIVKTWNYRTGAAEDLGGYYRPANQDLHSFCSEVAGLVELDLGRPVKWSMPTTQKKTSELKLSDTGAKLLKGMLCIAGVIAVCIFLYYFALVIVAFVLLIILAPLLAAGKRR